MSPRRNLPGGGKGIELHTSSRMWLVVPASEEEFVQWLSAISRIVTSNVQRTQAQTDEEKSREEFQLEEVICTLRFGLKEDNLERLSAVNQLFNQLFGHGVAQSLNNAPDIDEAIMNLAKWMIRENMVGTYSREAKDSSNGFALSGSSNAGNNDVSSSGGSCCLMQ